MNAMNNLIEQVLETSKTYFARLNAPEGPVGTPQLGPSETATSALAGGSEFPDPDTFTTVLETDPEGIRELSSPLSD